VLGRRVKFRKRIDADDLDGLRYFMRKFASPCGVVVTRDASRWDDEARVLHVPLPSFLLAF
jgi:hypothetical protein